MNTWRLRDRRSEQRLLFIYTYSVYVYLCLNLHVERWDRYLLFKSNHVVRPIKWAHTLRTDSQSLIRRSRTDFTCQQRLYDPVKMSTMCVLRIYVRRISLTDSTVFISSSDCIFDIDELWYTIIPVLQ